MTHYLRFVSAVAVLTALVFCVSVEAQTSEIAALRVLAEQGEPGTDSLPVGEDPGL